VERAVPHFRDELESLKSRLLEMGGLAEERVRQAVHGLVDRDTPLIEKVLRGDEPINSLHMEVDERSTPTSNAWATWLSTSRRRPSATRRTLP